MKIARVECLAAYAGWRIHDFVKITMRDGLVGWSEFSRAFGGPGVHQALAEIAVELIGHDPRSAWVTTSLLEFGRRSSIAQQACGALQNALLDIRARWLGVPVYELLGGRVRDRIRLYWAHCGTYRASHAELMHTPPLRGLSDLVSLGQEVVDGGYTALKTNLLILGDGRAQRYAPRASAEAASRTASPRLMRALGEQLGALREGVGGDVDIMVDLGSNFRTEGALAMARAAEPYRPAWVEIELREPAALRYIRERTSVPVAGGESLRSNEYHALLRSEAVDVAIVDVLYNGLSQSTHVAAACEAYETNVAVHNCYSPLATMMAASYCAVIPNLHMLEIDVDSVPWADTFVTHPPEIHDGHLRVPSGPGWGPDVDEVAVRAHPLPTPDQAGEG
jgi:galactonate dehydratase